jgi:hypothetical protein
MLLSHFSCLPNWCHVQVFPTSATWQRPRPSAGRISCNVLSMNFIVLFATIMCQIRQLFSSCKNSIFGVEDRQRPKASRFSRIARIIRLRQYDAEFINQMGSLASNISIANMPHTRANQIPTPSIPFRMGIRLIAISEPAPWNLEVGSVPGPKLEARRLINFCAKFVRSLCEVSAKLFHPSLRFKFALVVVI